MKRKRVHDAPIIAKHERQAQVEAEKPTEDDDIKTLEVSGDCCITDRRCRWLFLSNRSTI
jgi:hypothetical protein